LETSGAEVLPPPFYSAGLDSVHAGPLPDLLAALFRSQPQAFLARLLPAQDFFLGFCGR
jgi:hypothetical protein